MFEKTKLIKTRPGLAHFLNSNVQIRTDLNLTSLSVAVSMEPGFDLEQISYIITIVLTLNLTKIINFGGQLVTFTLKLFLRHFTCICAAGLKCIAWQ